MAELNGPCTKPFRVLKKLSGVLKCPECRMPISFEREVWYMNGKSYHPECVKDNKELYTQWKFVKKFT